MNRRDAQRAAYRMRHLDDSALLSRMQGFADGYSAGLADAAEDLIAYLKTTSAVTLAGRGGAYELLRVQRPEKDACCVGDDYCDLDSSPLAQSEALPREPFEAVDEWWEAHRG